MSTTNGQIAELLSWASELLPHGGTAVDFCAGSGHVGLVLAAVRPDAIVYIVEKKLQHCVLAQERAEKAGACLSLSSQWTRCTS